MRVSPVEVWRVQGKIHRHPALKWYRTHSGSHLVDFAEEKWEAVEIESCPMMAIYLHWQAMKQAGVDHKHDIRQGRSSRLGSLLIRSIQMSLRSYFRQ